MSVPTFLLDNIFENCTRRNYAKAHRISQQTDAKLQAKIADPAILAAYNIYHPAVIAYDTVYNAWDTQLGTQKGSTVAVNTLLAETADKLYTWELAIQTVYPKGSGNYTNIFPKGHAPFMQGKKDARIAAFHSLDTALTGIVALAATKTDVHNFYTALYNANQSQGNQKGNTQSDSTAVEAGRIAITTALLALYGTLLNKFAANPIQIADYMELSEVGRTEQTDFTGHVAEAATETIAKRTLTGVQKILLRNIGNTPLRFYLATLKTDAIGATFIEVPPMTDNEVNANQLGNVATQHFINVLNVDATFEGQYELIIE